MGNARSVEENTHSITSDADPFWNPSSIRNMSSNIQTEPEAGSSEDQERAEHRQQLQKNLHEFKQELARKHEKRREIIAEKRREFQLLQDEIQALKDENELLKKSKDTTDSKYKNAELFEQVQNLKDENDELKLQVEKLKICLNDGKEVQAKNKELRITVSEMQLDLQKLNSEMLNIEQERLEYTKHIAAMKDVVKVTKDMLEIRESQIQGLKSKVGTVEELLASKEMKLMSDGLREEYEKQLRNIRNLRTLYEERQRLDKIDKEHLQVQLEETKKQVENEQTISSDRLTRIQELEQDNSDKYDQITSLQSSLGLSKAECTELQAEIDVINQLFSQILLGFNNTQEIDFDKLIKILKENHDLLTDIASNEESHSTAAALPKVLLDLINQINNEKQPTPGKSTIDADEQSVQLNSPAEIVENLPKVWKVLIELLSHQNPPLSALKEGEKDPCYKSVETPTGTKLKLSVSQTFIRLKDLIIEKKFLEREMYRLKHLNTHLEGRLQDQEKRLELVSGELTTTWHVVEVMQKQHQQLHTHEKVLRYELHEKRKLLTELKEELEHCRQKWGQARAKNDSTQEQWKELRKEFAARKTQADDFNQSAESGYSDDKDSSEDDEKGYESDVSESKRESDCDDDLENNVQSAKAKAHQTRNATTTSENLEQFDGMNEDAVAMDMEMGQERHFEPSAQTVDSISDGDNNQTHIEVAQLAEKADTNSQDENISVVETDTTSSDITEKTFEQRLQEEENAQNLQNEHEKTVVKTPINQVNGRLSLEEANEASTSSSSSSVFVPGPGQEPERTRTAEEIFAARQERLKRLEEESQELFTKVTNTNLRSNCISNKLDSLYEMYGESNCTTTTEENTKSTVEKETILETTENCEINENRNIEENSNDDEEENANVEDINKETD